MNKSTMYKLSYGLFILTAQENGKDNGCIINTAIQVTSSPNRISIAVNKDNYTHDMILNTSRFTVSILSQDASFELFKHFGFQSGKTTDKFENFSACRRSSNGTMIVEDGTNAWISANVVSTVDLGTHTLFIADVVDGDVLSETPSATYEYYQKNIKPQPKPAAPAEGGKTVWRCTVCGYVYEGEELPADFICPLCKHPASDFEKVVQ